MTLFVIPAGSAHPRRAATQGPIAQRKSPAALGPGYRAGAQFRDDSVEPAHE
jgi:hypothetical protein